MIDKYIAEATDCDFKEAIELNKPKSWLKTVSAFADGIGGTIFFGVDDDRSIVGLSEIKNAIDSISKLLRERITPLPEFIVTPVRAENGKDVIILEVLPGSHTPYYYNADGVLQAYIRVGSDSVPTNAQQLNRLVLKGQNIDFDSLPTDYRFTDISFTVLDAAYKKLVKSTLTLKEHISFGLVKPDGTLTFAGLLFTDDCPVLQARVFCTRWNGLSKGSTGDDAIDSEEFEGDIISLLKNSHNFVRLNSKERWKKMPDYRIDKPDYAERAVFEALANALMHRDWSVVGSEVHVDMYDDRLDIYSPGGMPDGSLIQNLDIENVPSIRRNPTIAEMFHRLDYIERKGSGFEKIRLETSYLHGYTDNCAPKFRSTPSAFHVTLMNVNYNLHGATEQDTEQVTTQDAEQDERAAKLLEYCGIARTRDEMQKFCGIAHREHFRASILKPLLESGKLEMTIPEKPNSRNQRYIRG